MYATTLQNLYTKLSNYILSGCDYLAMTLTPGVVLV